MLKPWAKLNGDHSRGNHAVKIGSFCIMVNAQVKRVAHYCYSIATDYKHGAVGRRIDPSSRIQLSCLSTQPVLHDWYNKVRGMMHIKEPLLLIGKSNPCGGSVFPVSLSEWSYTICLTPYNRT